jgi:hypothetical protein
LLPGDYRKPLVLLTSELQMPRMRGSRVLSPDARFQRIYKWQTPSNQQNELARARTTASIT